MSEVAGAPIEGWGDEALRHTADANFGLGTDAGLPDSVRFLVGVARAVRKRHQEADLASEEVPAIFFLQPRGPADTAVTLRSQPMLDNGLAPLGGCFWFVASPVYGALGLEVSDWSDDARVFEKAIDELGLGGVPAVLFDPRGKYPVLRHYHAGLAKLDDVRVLSPLTEKMDLDRIIEIVDDETRAHLDGPGGGARLWKDAKKRWPSDKAEKKIQFALKVALHHALPTAVIREEQSQVAGRLDLEVEEPLLDGEFIRHAILELKVLRSFGSTGGSVPPGEVRKVVKEGVQQAVAYRKERSAKAAALCCFDMRIKNARKQCFRGVKSQAEKEKLKLRVWPIYASATERRAAEN